MTRPYWLAEVTDVNWCNRIRKDYPDDTKGMDDEAIREYYADGRKYADLWDHLDDARDDYEQLADAYIALLKKQKAK